MPFRKLLTSGRSLVLALGLVLGALASFSGIGPAIDRALDSVRYAASGRAASGQIVVVEMDAASVAAIRSWPWPRRHYAVVVDRLRQAGAASIAFDVEFSSATTAHDDAMLAAALARAQGLVALPTFAQEAGSGERRHIDTLPLPALRENAVLASVTMIPDPDGVVRSAPLGTVTDQTPRPSLSAFLARRSGEVGTFFPIDYSIDPGTLPRLSFIAVRDGRFDSSLVRGRDVIIGATAVEMGDRYAAPRWGVIPGVIVQAMGAETLLRGIPFDGQPLLALAAAALLGSIVAYSSRLIPLVGCAVAAIFVVAVVSVQQQFLCYLPLSPGLVLLTTVILGRIALDVAARFKAQRLVDQTTGLPNRFALRACDADWTNTRLAVATIVNHDQLAAVLSAGAERDLVLRIGERLQMAAELRTVWRLSDRLLAFAVTEEADRLDAIRALMLRPIEVQGRALDVVLAVGVAEVIHGSVDRAIAEATLASERANQEGAFWLRAHEDMEAISHQLSLMGELDTAILTGAIEVHYQPKLAIAQNKIVSAEALVRWHHPTRGFLGPDLFIPLAEQTGRIAPLTIFVLRTALVHMEEWSTAGVSITVAINISAKLIASDAFNADVREILAGTTVAPSSLIFEVTESAAIVDPAAATRALQGYRDLGIAISMDDYGTGQSTLSYLQQLPLSELKIDRRFVQNAHLNRNDAILVQSTIEMAHQLGLKVVAEGVEDPAALIFLRSVGCDLAQGYLIGKPASHSDFVGLICQKPMRSAA